MPDPGSRTQLQTVSCPESLMNSGMDYGKLYKMYQILTTDVPELAKDQKRTWGIVEKLVNDLKS
jgi:intracellular sulfur oxidation DsrE/DsrF family protein